MEEKEMGCIDSIEIVFVKTDPELIKSLAIKHEIPEKTIKKMMRYNVWTMKQFCQLAKKDISTITNLTKPTVINTNTIGVMLDFCYPLADFEGDGPKCILRNDKSEKYLRG